MKCQTLVSANYSLNPSAHAHPGVFIKMGDNYCLGAPFNTMGAPFNTMNAAFSLASTLRKKQQVKPPRSSSENTDVISGRQLTTNILTACVRMSPRHHSL